MDSWTRKDRASQAESLLGHRIFGEAVEVLAQSYLEQIRALPIGSPGLQTVHAKIRVLEELVGELRHFVADAKLHKADE